MSALACRSNRRRRPRCARDCPAWSHNLPSRNAIHAQLCGAGRLPFHRSNDIPCRSVNLIVRSNKYISLASVIAPGWVAIGKKSCGLEKELLLMWIVRVALDRPYTFIVLALMILLLSVVAIARTPTDIFPSIDIPVIAVDWTYTGLNPEELEGRLTSPTRARTSTRQSSTYS